MLIGNTDDGVLRCSRYAFGPNRLHYCGPDANREIFSYINESITDVGLTALLKKFETLYPYLRLIAEANALTDPFHEKVVEAYWLGNQLLENVSKKQLYKNLVDDHSMKKRLTMKAFGIISDKIGGEALPHHSFHVLNIWKNTGTSLDEQIIESMRECIVSWGTVTKVAGPAMTVSTQPFIYETNHFCLGEPIYRIVYRPFDTSDNFEDVKVGDIITLHWGVPCEIISPTQAKVLEHYTKQSIALANKFIP
ncbi:MAG: DUF6390 family protein [Candidatus Moraniibacteriota bacterium]